MNPEKIKDVLDMDEAPASEIENPEKPSPPQPTAEQQGNPSLCTDKL